MWQRIKAFFKASNISFVLAGMWVVVLFLNLHSRHWVMVGLACGLITMNVVTGLTQRKTEALRAKSDLLWETALEKLEKANELRTQSKTT